MTCARRPAGARTPAPSTPAGSPSRPEPRFGRTRARLFLLPALALLLGALSLFAAAPVEAQSVRPDPPRNVALTTGNNQVTLTWDAPASWGSGTPDGYTVNIWSDLEEYALSSVGNIDLGDASPAIPGYDAALSDSTSSSLSLTIPQRTYSGPTLFPENGKTIVIQVKPVAQITISGSISLLGGNAAEARVTVGVPAKIAPAPTVTPGAAKLDLTWTAPAQNGGAISGYDVHYTSAATGSVADDAAVTTGAASAGWVAVSRSGTTASQAITGLTVGTAYRVRVRAKNTHGDGAWVFGTGTPTPPPEVSLSAPSQVTEGLSVTVTATLSAPASSAVTIPVTLAAGTAEAGDYGTLASIAISSGATSGTGTIATNHDTDDEDETFTVALGTLPSGYVAGSPSSVTVTIADDEGRTRVALLATSALHGGSLQGGAVKVVEGQQLSLQAHLSRHLRSGFLQIPLITRRVTSEFFNRGHWGDDHDDPHSVTIYKKGGPSPDQIGTTRLSTRVDSDHDDEVFTVEIDASRLPAGYLAGSPSKLTVTIVDCKDECNSPMLSVLDTITTERSPYGLHFQLLLDKPAPEDVTVRYRTADGTAAAGQDYRAKSGTVTIRKATRGVTVRVNVIDDTVNDSGETVRLVVLGADGAFVADAEGIGTIYNHEADLAALAVEGASGAGGPWSALAIGAFAAATEDYAVTVPHGTTHARLVPTALHGGQTLRAGPSSDVRKAESGAAGPAIPLAVGDNALVVRSSLSTGETKTYTVTVTRAAAPALSSNADLSGLTLEAGAGGSWSALDIGGFAAATTNYAVTVPYGTTHARLTATAAHAKAALKGGAAVALAVGANALAVEVTAEDGTVKTYTVTVTRAAAPALSSNADLSGLTLEAGAGGSWSALDIGGFAAATTNYAVTVPYGTTHARLTATAAHAKAALKGGAAVALAVGANALAVEVTAEDGTVKTYTVTVTREAARPLTAAFENVPAEHDGGSGFPLDVRFSEALGEGGTAPVAASFAVSGGAVEQVRRTGPGLWRVRIVPKNWKDVTVTLAGGRACNAAGAVCTADGRPLSNTLAATVGGPARLRIEGARAHEGKDATLDFAVSLSRAASHAVSVDYATVDDTATAGSDYTAVSGTLVFAAGETAKTIAVPVLDDAVDEGKEKLRLVLSHPRGAYLRKRDYQAMGVIYNDDPLQKMWLSRFGRTVGGHVTDAVSDRLLNGLAPGAHATIAGQAVNLAQVEDGTALTDVLTGLAQRFGARAPAGGDDPFARHGPGGGPGGGLGAPVSTASAGSSPAEALTGRELLLGSSFHVAGGGEGSGPGLAVWGRVSRGEFRGEEASDSGPVRIDGQWVITNTLGADADWGRVLAGVAVSLSEGEGTFEQPGVDRGDVDSTLTTVSPYARFEVTERVSAWGLGAYGTGSTNIEQSALAAAEGRPARPRTKTTTEISMQMGAAGARGELLTQDEAGGMDLALKADAFFVRMASKRAPNSAATTADASRLRLVLEGGRAFALSDTATLRPTLELGVRHDGGDAETGAGVEVGGGVSYADAATGLSLEATARLLVAHAASDYREWGASATARFDPGEHGRGLSFSLSPTLGTASSATDRLWGAHDPRAFAPAGEAGSGFEAARGLQAEASYGMALSGGRFTATPNVGFGSSDGVRDWRVGWRLAPAGPGGGFEFNLDALRREAVGEDAAEHGVMLRSLIRW